MSDAYESADALREPFPQNLIEHRDGFDYVGHSAVTDRLLKVDPEWTWEPMGLTESGIPAIDYRHMGTRRNKKGEEYQWHIASMWIRLTVAGVTRPGVGETEVYPWSDSTEKKLISDALKNAAMRFGVALDLWSKEDLLAEPPPPPEPSISDDQVSQISTLFDRIGDHDERIRVKVDWAKGLEFRLQQTPVSRFDEVYASAMDAVEAAASAGEQSLALVDGDETA